MEDQTALAATPRVMARYFPAEVQLPAIGDQPARTVRPARVYVTDTPELIVYSAPGVEALRSAVDLAATDDPPPPHPRQTWDVVTAAGTVPVTPAGGCGCGSALRRWTPDYAAHLTAWRSS